MKSKKAEVWGANEGLQGRIEEVAGRVLRGERMRGRVRVIIVSDEELKDLHGRFLRRRRKTDVMAFPLGERGWVGEVYVSRDRARAEAKKRGIPVEEELVRYVAHGILHLLGYDDHAPRARKRMWAAQERYVTLVSHNFFTRRGGM